MLPVARRALGSLIRMPSLQAAAGSRGYALDGMRSFNEHEAAVEKLYFNKVGRISTAAAICAT